MATYEFEPHAVFQGRDEADAQVIGEVLEKLTSENDGRLKPDYVVEVARKRSHPLHKHFEWNDTEAAEKYRLDQARALIRSVRLVSDDEVINESRAYYALNDDGWSYRSVSEIVTSAMLQLTLHKQGLRDLLAWQNRYRGIASVCTLVNVASQALESTIHKMEEEQAQAKTKEEPPSPRPRGGRRGSKHSESRPSA